MTAIVKFYWIEPRLMQTMTSWVTSAIRMQTTTEFQTRYPLIFSFFWSFFFVLLTCYFNTVKLKLVRFLYYDADITFYLFLNLNSVVDTLNILIWFFFAARQLLVGVQPSARGSRQRRQGWRLSGRHRRWRHPRLHGQLSEQFKDFLNRFQNLPGLPLTPIQNNCGRNAKQWWFEISCIQIRMY